MLSCLRRIIYSGIPILPFFFLFLVYSCAEGDISVVLLPRTKVCVLSDDVLIDYPYSMEMIDSCKFVVSSSDKVLMFSTSGQLIREIGNSGRAIGEYSFPMKVRKGDSGDIFVWSAGTMKFIQYDCDGVFKKEYPYESAISDFKVYGGRIYIYTAGQRADNIIDVLDLSNGGLSGFDKDVSEFHKLLATNISPAPIWLLNDNVYYAPKDVTEIRVNDGGEAACLFKSKSFFVDKKVDLSQVKSSRRKRQEYLAEASYNLLLFEKDGELELLSYEGESEISDNRLDNSNRIITLYSIGKNARHFPAESIGCLSSLSICGGKCYFLEHKIIEGNDSYSLFSTSF